MIGSRQSLAHWEGILATFVDLPEEIPIDFEKRKDHEVYLEAIHELNDEAICCFFSHIDQELAGDNLPLSLYPRTPTVLDAFVIREYVVRRKHMIEELRKKEEQWNAARYVVLQEPWYRELFEMNSEGAMLEIELSMLVVQRTEVLIHRQLYGESLGFTQKLSHWQDGVVRLRETLQKRQKQERHYLFREDDLIIDSMGYSAAPLSPKQEKLLQQALSQRILKQINAREYERRVAEIRKMK